MKKSDLAQLTTGQQLTWKNQVVELLESGIRQKYFVRLEDGTRKLIGYRSLHLIPVLEIVEEIELTTGDIIEDVQPVELTICQEMYLEACKPRVWDVEPELTITQKLLFGGWLTSVACLFGLITHVFYA